MSVRRLLAGVFAAAVGLSTAGVLFAATVQDPAPAPPTKAIELPAIDAKQPTLGQIMERSAPRPAPVARREPKARIIVAEQRPCAGGCGGQTPPAPRLILGIGY